MRSSVLRKRERKKRKRWNAEGKMIDVSFLDPMLTVSNETLFTCLCSTAAPDQLKEDVLWALLNRMKPIIFSKASEMYRLLGWNGDDAVIEAAELIWEMSKQGRYDRDRTSYAGYFKTCYGYRLTNIYRKQMRHHPDMTSSKIVGYSAGKPVEYMMGSFNLSYINRDGKPKTN